MNNTSENRKFFIAKKDICVEEVEAVVKSGSDEQIGQGVIIK